MGRRRVINVYLKKAWVSSFEGFFLEKFLRIVQTKGKKEKVENLLLRTLSLLKKNMLFFKGKHKHPLYFLMFLFIKNKPLLGIKKIRVGVTDYFIPVPLNRNQSVKKSIKDALGSKKGKDFVSNLVFEAFNSRVNKLFSIKAETHKMALKNRKFLHFRWF
jgi:ribosomal protein S7